METNPSRDKLQNVCDALIKLAAHKEWWSAEEYPEPTGDELQNRFLIHADEDNSYALYLNVMKPGKKIVPHNHTTWACIAAVEGTEQNYLYDRTDDGKTSGHATLVEKAKLSISPGAGIALMPDDIHAVRIEDSSIRHLHLYGRALETLTERLAFDMENNTCKVMDIGVKTRVS
ncbi:MULTISPECIES: hypothetical protein [Pelistega]|nr:MULTISPECIES: hypothetical protein [Pelistega]